YHAGTPITTGTVFGGKVTKTIPIRNVLVMTNEKPKEEFKHVKVLSLSELNGYIQYFEPLFSGKEVKSIFEYLINRKNINP
ncbi:MAG TPA: hypothetical protein PKB02_18245, partial [Anaerohalosphaeraceae bacterium]|nr:hypothetical protein [Anaerohalosphaeraceae bacterium]